MNQVTKLSFMAVFLILSICAAIYLPVVWIAIIVLFEFMLFLLYLYMQLKRAILQEFEKHNDKFIESGKAITDTLKVAFDNLKKMAGEQQKLNGKLREYNSKLHRLEQSQHRMAGIAIKKEIDGNGEIQDSERNSRSLEIQQSRHSRINRPIKES